MEKAKP